MELIRCPKCGAFVQEADKFCPKCGAEMTPQTTSNNAMKPWLIGGLVVFLAAIAAAFGYFFGQTSQKTAQEETKTAIADSSVSHNTEAEEDSLDYCTPKPKAENLLPATSTPARKAAPLYYVVVGSYPTISEAQNWNYVCADGLEGAIYDVIVNGKKMYRVCIACYTNRQEAQNEVNSIKRLFNDNRSAWIWENNGPAHCVEHPVGCNGKPIYLEPSTTSAPSNTSSASSTSSTPTYIEADAYDGILNVRRSASAKSSIVEIMDNGDRAEYIGRTGNWYKVRYRGTVGYVHRNHCREIY